MLTLLKTKHTNRFTEAHHRLSSHLVGKHMWLVSSTEMTSH